MKFPCPSPLIVSGVMFFSVGLMLWLWVSLCVIPTVVRQTIPLELPVAPPNDEDPILGPRIIDYVELPGNVTQARLRLRDGTITNLVFKPATK